MTKLRNPSVQVGARNVRDDYAMANALEAMLKDLAKETPQAREARLAKRPTICGMPNPKYRPTP